MRIALASIGQEQSTFNPAETPLAAFRAQGLWTGDEILRHEAGVGMVGGLLASLAARIAAGDVQPVPLVKATAVPAGRMAAAVLTELTAMLTDALASAVAQAGPPDGIALLMHGACAATGVDDVEGHLLAAVRSVVGDQVPIAVGLDHHANITEAMMRQAFGQTTRRDGTERPSGPGRSCGIDIVSDGSEVGDVARRHSRQRRLAAESAVRPVDPGVGELRIGINDLQRLPDAGDIADAAQRIVRQPGHLALLPLEESPLRGRAEDGAHHLIVGIPAGHDAEEALHGQIVSLRWKKADFLQFCIHLPVSCIFA